ncbi:hypothetical protein GQ457_02G042370 [Hibiscus cannabinus]
MVLGLFQHFLKHVGTAGHRNGAINLGVKVISMRSDEQFLKRSTGQFPAAARTNPASACLSKASSPANPISMLNALLLNTLHKLRHFFLFWNFWRTML